MPFDQKQLVFRIGDRVFVADKDERYEFTSDDPALNGGGHPSPDHIWDILRRTRQDPRRIGVDWAVMTSPNTVVFKFAGHLYKTTRDFGHPAQPFGPVTDHYDEVLDQSMTEGLYGIDFIWVMDGLSASLDVDVTSHANHAYF